MYPVTSTSLKFNLVKQYLDLHDSRVLDKLKRLVCLSSIYTSCATVYG